MKRISWLGLEPILCICLLIVVFSVGIPHWRQSQAPKPLTTYEVTSVDHSLPAFPSVVELPFGGRTVLPSHRLVALYGSPDTPRLGVLGEQSIEASVERIKRLTAHYQTLMTEKALPCLEIITTVASAGPTSDGNYSRELDLNLLRPWIDAAKTNGVYVVLDLQPGRTDFLTQAKIYEEFLKQPHVGLALDPEWRLLPNQIHLKQIGSVDADEVNRTALWLADLTKQHSLPQKVFLLHQFKRTMISRRELVDTSRPELAYVIQMDGNGGQPSKQETWRFIREGASPNFHFGWKNFHDEDKPMLTPEQTMQVSPAPWYISYQ